jgi:putative molybdopterin biosynthesis protein
MRLIPTLSWRLDADTDALDPRLLPLLEAIVATGSLAAGVAACGLSYRAAWGLLRDYERRLGAPLVELERGRGARLAAAGERLLSAHHAALKRLARILPALGADLMPASATRAAELHVAASHDLLLAALRAALPKVAKTTLEVAFMGSLHALEQFSEGRVDIAGFHVAMGTHAPGHLEPFRRLLRARRDRLIRFVDREQGLMLPSGNPARVRTLGDVARKRLRFINRQSGSGTRLIIDGLLTGEKIAPGALVGYSNEEFTHPAVAATIAAGGADAGFGLRAAAAERGLAFVPLVTERYYLAVRASELDSTAVARLRQWLQEPAFARLARGFAGYDPRQAGSLENVTALGAA